MTECPRCGQKIPEVRLGARMTPLKARMFDRIKRSGDAGIQARELHDNPTTAKAHINQINEMIEDSGYRIRGRDRFYRLEKRA